MKVGGCGRWPSAAPSDIRISWTPSAHRSSGQQAPSVPRGPAPPTASTAGPASSAASSTPRRCNLPSASGRFLVPETIDLRVRLFQLLHQVLEDFGRVIRWARRTNPVDEPGNPAPADLRNFIESHFPEQYQRRVLKIRALHLAGSVAFDGLALHAQCMGVPALLEFGF